MNQKNFVASQKPNLPIALPIVSSNDPTTPQATADSSSSTGTETTPPRAVSNTPATPVRRVGHRQLDSLRGSLSERDLDVITRVAQHRYLTTRQVEAFCFTDHATPASAARTARRVLRRLASHGLIRPLERRVGGVRAGSASYIWQLGPVGFRLLQADGKLKRTHEPSQRFLAHCLAIADAHLMMLNAHRDGRLEQITVETEPECWRSYTGPGGERRVLQPDLFVITRQPGYVDHWFCEIDLGSESLNTLLGKCAQYEAYRSSGIEQSSAGVFPLVVWQLPTQERLDKLASGIARSRQLLPELFRLVLPDGLASLIVGGAA